jgi:transposase-like protein
VAQASRDLDVHENVLRKWIRDFVADPGQAFASRSRLGDHVTPQQYGRLLDGWVALIGLDPALYATHRLRRTKVTSIYRRTGSLRARQLLLGRFRLESTVRYLGIEADDVLILPEQTDL